eukprot:554387-Rhodomonas_salina.1
MTAGQPGQSEKQDGCISNPTFFARQRLRPVPRGARLTLSRHFVSISRFTELSLSLVLWCKQGLSSKAMSTAERACER